MLRASLVVLMVLGFLTAACSSAGPTPSGIEYSAFVASSVHTVGENRHLFALVSGEFEQLETPEVQVRYYLLRGEETPELRATALAKFRQSEGVTPHQHADRQVHQHIEVRGVHVVDSVVFDRSGFWRAEFDVPSEPGERVKVGTAAFEVTDDSIVPDVGDLVPPSENLTLADVDSIEEIETRVPPDDMHELSVAQALQQDKPFVVVFAAPMFCVSRMCGPVTDVVAELHSRYRDRANFIHIEPWDLAMARGQGRLVPTKITLEWNLPTEPWIFVVDRSGRVAARFEALVATEELEAALIPLIGERGDG